MLAELQDQDLPDSSDFIRLNDATPPIPVPPAYVGPVMLPGTALIGASLTPETVTVASWSALVPPSPSVSAKRTVRAPVVGASVSVFW